MIKIKKILKIGLLLSLFILTSGCFDYSELNNMDIIVGMGINKIDDNYEVTYEVINTSIDKNNTEAKKSFTVTSADISLTKAINKTTSKLNKKAYFEHMKVVLIEPTINILELSDYFSRSNDISSNFFLVLTDNPKEVLEYTAEDKKINAEEVYNILTNINYTSLNTHFDFQINDILNKKRDITIPYVSLEEKLIFKSYGLYQKEKFITYLSKDRIPMYNFYLKNQDISLEEEGTSIRIYKSKANIKVKKKATITLELKANIEKLDKDISLRTDDNFKELEKIFADKLTKDMRDFITYLQEIDCDILGFNNLNFIKKKVYLDDYFSKTQVEININLKINRPGLTVRKVS